MNNRNLKIGYYIIRERKYTFDNNVFTEIAANSFQMKFLN
jgi:hypothetical protein